jgi:hypothetical protein
MLKSFFSPRQITVKYQLTYAIQPRANTYMFALGCLADLGKPSESCVICCDLDTRFRLLTEVCQTTPLRVQVTLLGRSNILNVIGTSFKHIMS